MVFVALLYFTLAVTAAGPGTGITLDRGIGVGPTQYRGRSRVGRTKTGRKKRRHSWLKSAETPDSSFINARKFNSPNTSKRLYNIKHKPSKERKRKMPKIYITKLPVPQLKENPKIFFTKLLMENPSSEKDIENVDKEKMDNSSLSGIFEEMNLFRDEMDTIVGSESTIDHDIHNNNLNEDDLKSVNGMMYNSHSQAVNLKVNNPT